MTTFVLIHGSYQGGWIWQPVAKRLREAGHNVYAPTLDGCGERRHQVRPGIDATTQASEIADLLFFEDLHDVVLVGTSSGGMVVCRAAELARERIARLVFVDALALFNGERIRDIVTRSTSVTSGLTSGPSREDAEQRLFADLEPINAGMGARALHAASGWRLRDAGEDRQLLESAMADDGCLVSTSAESGRGASATYRRTAQGQMVRTGYRTLSDAQHAKRIDGAADVMK